MKLGIMQPYFFPYLGYFSLIAATDQWIVFDTPQYIRRGWINRNRVLKRGGNNGEWKYIGVPIEHAGRETPIDSVRIHPDCEWPRDVIRNLDYYHACRAPYYDRVVTLLHNCPLPSDRKLTVALVGHLEHVCRYLQIPFNCVRFSEANIPVHEVDHPGEWALRICKSMGAAEYINPPGGRDIFRRREFDDANILLKFLQPHLPPYPQHWDGFTPGLSVLDAMMFNSPSDVRRLIEQFSIVE